MRLPGDVSPKAGHPCGKEMAGCAGQLRRLPASHGDADPRRCARAEASGDASLIRDFGSSEVELPVAYPHGEHSDSQ